MRHNLFIDGAFCASDKTRVIRSPASGEVIATVDEADQALMERALAAASQCFPRFRGTSRYARSRLLAEMASGIAARRKDLVASIVDEAGKPVTLSDGEVSRAITTFTIGAEEAKRYGGELFPVDIDATGRAYDLAQSLFTPRGPVLAITPFNFPLNLVAHKVVPALAVGAPVLVKPAPQTPGATRILAEIFAEARARVSDARDEVPPAALQVVSAPNEIATAAVIDPRIAVVSFTGSATVGWSLQGIARQKKIVLELGGNAAVIVHDDADLARAAARSAFGAYAYAGQVCISVQNIYVQSRVYERFKELFVAEVKKVRSGDPKSEGTLSGPLIDEKAADRLMVWIEEAKQGGARVLEGGAREGNTLSPTVIEGAPATSAIVREEAFGPVAVIASYERIDEAIAAVNSSRYGLQAGLFTDRLSVIREVVAGLDVGGILINEVPTYRADHMPYGGVKGSGLGREGVRYAMEEYSERKTVIFWRG
jgi:acyl-CoA reductase-like NAD-dependent aldehyde dehydrogenase